METRSINLPESVYDYTLSHLASLLERKKNQKDDLYERIKHDIFSTVPEAYQTGVRRLENHIENGHNRMERFDSLVQAHMPSQFRLSDTPEQDYGDQLYVVFYTLARVPLSRMHALLHHADQHMTLASFSVYGDRVQKDLDKNGLPFSRRGITTGVVCEILPLTGIRLSNDKGDVSVHERRQKVPAYQSSALK